MHKRIPLCFSSFQVETTLAAYIWFTLNDDQPMPEFIYADLCLFDRNERSTTEWETFTEPTSIPTEPPATHPEKPWYNSNCVETYDVLPVMDIYKINGKFSTESRSKLSNQITHEIFDDKSIYLGGPEFDEKCTRLGNPGNCYKAFFIDESIEISVPENQFREEGYTLQIFLNGGIHFDGKEIKICELDVVLNKLCPISYGQLAMFLPVNSYFVSYSVAFILKATPKQLCGEVVTDLIMTLLTTAIIQSLINGMNSHRKAGKNISRI